MTDTPSLVPAGIGHDTDLAALPYAERMKVHRRRIQAILPEHGKAGKDAYVAAHPEASTVRVRLGQSKAYLAKPPGYADALANCVSHWFNSAAALEQTNKADVERLNVTLSTSFPASNHFNARLSVASKKRLAEVFREHGAYFDADRIDSMSQVREAVQAAKAAARPDYTAFGLVGHRTQNTLDMGTATFTIEKNGNRECIRPRIEGRKRRLYLDDILWLTNLLAGDDGKPSRIALRSKLVERAYSPKIVPNSRQATDASDSLGLSDRIRHLNAAYYPVEQQPPDTDGIDPLALI